MNLNFLKSSNLRGNLTVTGDISGNNLRTSFNQGSATGDYSFAEGLGTASGEYSHAEGSGTLASDFGAHAEGTETTALGDSSHAEGYQTTALGMESHAEGFGTRASGSSSHAEGEVTVAHGAASHAAGYRATAAQDYTYAWSDGELGTLSENVSSTRTGQYMVSASGGMFIPGRVGIGTDSIDNALTVVGNTSATGVVYASGGNSNQWNSTYTTFTNNSANYILNGGNSKGTNLLIGTNDNYSLNLETAGTTKVTITSGGEVNVGGVTDGGGARVYGFAAQNNSATNPGKFVIGGYFTQPHGNASRSIGVYADAYSGPTTTGYVAGLEGRAWVTGSSGTMPLAYGLNFQALHYGTGITLNDLIGINVQSKFYSTFSTGVINNAYGIYGIVGSGLTAGQTLTNSYGLRLDIGASTNAYGIYIPTFNTAPTGTNNWGLWVQGGANNYIEGNVGIGTQVTPQKLTVSGSISSTGVVYASGGNSDQWNANTTIVQSNSSYWQDAAFQKAHAFGSLLGTNTALGPYMMQSRADDAFVFNWGTDNPPGYSLPFYCTNGKSLSTIRIDHISGTHPTAQLEVGIYAANSNGLPDTYIEKVGFSLSTTGSKTMTLTTPYRPTGLFWLIIRPTLGDTNFKAGGNGVSLSVRGYNNGYNLWASTFFGLGANTAITQYWGSLMPQRGSNSNPLPTSSILSQLFMQQTANGGLPAAIVYN
jgi:hypothetical protein